MSRTVLKLLAAWVRGTSMLAACLAFATVSHAANEPNPYAMADSSWITISGSVSSVDRDSFILDYGDGTVIVEMDDGDRDADAYALLAGEKVTVSGRIDDDFLETTTIEANSVYVESIGTTFFASSADEENVERLAAAITVPVTVSRAEIQGTVTSVAANEFTVDAGSNDITVDVGAMPENPLDDEGYLRVRSGDRVRVTGVIDTGLFDVNEIEATSIMKLNM